MSLAVDLDAETRLEAGEVEAVGAERELSAKFEVAGAFAEFAPQDDFGEIAAAAFAAGVGDRFGACVQDRWRDPSTTGLRPAVPLPVPGRF